MGRSPVASAAVSSPARRTLLSPTSYADIDGWDGDAHAAAFATFLMGARLIDETAPKTRALGIDGVALQRVARAALRAGTLDRPAAKRFFEHHFVPHRIHAAGFVTGYYEPELAASRTRSDDFSVPLYRRPDDLVELDAAARPPGWDPQQRFARHTKAGPVPYFDRAAIEDGALAGRGLELAWLASAIDAFFVHVQGSARLRLTDGGTLRVGFDGKSGHSYTSIGRLAVARGWLAREAADKYGLEGWLSAHPDKARALMRENRSFIFFRETNVAEHDGPLGAAGVPLTPGRSLAVDSTLMTFHAPVWVDVPALREPDGAVGYRRLMIAQDTGSAIVGPARGDLFFGSGGRAGALAGGVRHAAAMTVLVPLLSELA